MKKYFIILSLFIISTSMVFAEKWMNISLNMGLLNFRYNNFIQDTFYKEKDVFYMPSFGIRYEFGMNRVSFAAEINYMEMFPIKPAKGKGYEERTHYFDSTALQFAIRINGFFYKSDRISYYSGIYGGLEYKSIRWEENAGSTDTVPQWKTRNTGFYITPYAGITLVAMRYTSKSGFFIDIPFITVGYPFDIGICSSFSFGWRFWSR